MFELSFLEIHSSFFSKVEAYDLADMVETHAFDLLGEWIQSVVASPRVMKFFNTLELDTDNGVFACSLNRPSSSEDIDKLYIRDLLATGVALKWIEPKYRSALNTSQVFGSKEEKFYAQANHMNAILQMKQDMESTFFKLIRDYGVYNNDYIE